MMRSTKITIALALGIAGAAGLGFMLTSEPAEADVPLKIYADASFAANPDENIPLKTLQLKSGSNVVMNYSVYPLETKYNRGGDGGGYKLSIKGGANCVVVSGEYEGTSSIPKDAEEVYLTFDKTSNSCFMELGKLVEFQFNIYAKNINNSGVKLKSVNAANEEKIINDNVTNSVNVPVIKTYQFEVGSTEKLVVDFYGSAVNCKLGEKEEITSELKSLNVVIDGAAKTCKLAPPVVKMKFKVEGSPYVQQKIYAILGVTSADYEICDILPDYAGSTKVFYVDKAGEYEFDVERTQGVDCAVLPIWPMTWFYTEAISCIDSVNQKNPPVFPMEATVANITAYWGSNRSTTTCTINSYE
jgi:hypothetical protein